MGGHGGHSGAAGCRPRHGDGSGHDQIAQMANDSRDRHKAKSTKSVYADAAWVLDQLDAASASLKTLVYSDNVRNTRACYAIVCETLKYRAALTETIGASGILEAAPRLAVRPNAALVLAYDLLLGRGSVTGSGAWQVDFRRHAAAVQTAWQAVLDRHGVGRDGVTVDALMPASLRSAPWIPRWARVNRLRRSVEQVLAFLQETGYTVVPPSTPLVSLRDGGGAVEGLVGPGGRWVRRDDLLPDLLALPPTATTLEDVQALHADGTLIFQDKASCLPAYALGVNRGVRHAIDACAAPGNKTSCLAALMRNAGRITACDVSATRLRTLVALTRRAGATNIEPWHGDFLAVDPADVQFADVTHILVDPSCSGSGIVTRRLEDAGRDGGAEADGDVPSADADPARLAKLAEFQTSAVLHALSFPAVQRVVYSTCSVHVEENEAVVQEALAAAPDFTLAPVFPSWPRYGMCLRNCTHNPLKESNVGKCVLKMQARAAPV